MIDCTKCPDRCGCCGIMIFDKSFLEKFKDKIQGKPMKIIEKGDSATYLYDDCRCPFLDRTALRCAIYEDRPEICRIYGTGKPNDPRILCPFFKPNGNAWSEAKRKQLERIRDRMVKVTLEKAEKENSK